MNIDEILKFQAYVHSNWSLKYDNVLYTKKLWDLADAAISDRPAALGFIMTHLEARDEKDRVTAAIMAGQFCNPIDDDDLTTARKVTAAVLKAVAEEKHKAVLRNLGDTLGFMVPSAELIKAIIDLSRSNDETIRYAATRSLSGPLNDELATDDVIKRLIELTSDKDADVRDWATFALVNLVDIYEVNRQDIADAFFARITDRHRDTRSEGFRGLAAARDERGIEPLKRFLEKSKSIGKLDVESAAVYARPELHDALVKMSKWWDADKELLVEAIKRCKPTKKNP